MYITEIKRFTITLAITIQTENLQFSNFNGDQTSFTEAFKFEHLFATPCTSSTPHFQLILQSGRWIVFIRTKTNANSQNFRPPSSICSGGGSGVLAGRPGRYQTKLPSLQLTSEAFLGHPTVIQPQTDILINFYHHFLNWKSLTGRNLIHYILWCIVYFPCLLIGGLWIYFFLSPTNNLEE